MKRIASISLGLFLLGGVVLAVRHFAQTHEPLPKYSSVADFDLIDQNGAPFSSKVLQDKVWVANFIFTRCPSICPRFTAKMSQLERQSRVQFSDLTLVSFTVDPEFDTPEKLKPYAQKYDANFDRWSFVTGPRETLERVIMKGLLQPMDKGDGADMASIVHGSHFVLVDGQGQVRGFYKLEDTEAISKLLADARRIKE